MARALVTVGQSVHIHPFDGLAILATVALEEGLYIFACFVVDASRLITIKLLVVQPVVGKIVESRLLALSGITREHCDIIQVVEEMASSFSG